MLMQRQPVLPGPSSQPPRYAPLAERPVTVVAVGGWPMLAILLLVVAGAVLVTVGVVQMRHSAAMARAELARMELQRDAALGMARQVSAPELDAATIERIAGELVERAGGAQ